MRNLALSFVMALTFIAFTGCGSSNSTPVNMQKVQDNFNGSWTGAGEMNSQGEKSACSSVSFTLHLENSFGSFGGFEAKCGDATYTKENIEFNIQGSAIVVDGKIYGTFNDNSILVSINEDGFNYKLSMKLEGENIILSETLDAQTDEGPWKMNLNAELSRISR